MQRAYDDIQKVKDNQNMGAVIRSREQNVINGEQPTKYFYNQEVIHKRNSTISKVKIGNNKYATTHKDIQNEITE